MQLQDDDPKGGTTPEPTDDGSAEATGTREAEGADVDAGDEQTADEAAQLRADLDRERNARQQLLAEKNNWARDRSELDDLRRRVQQGPPTQEAAPQANSQAMAELEEAMLELRVAAQNGDKLARLQLASLQRQHETEQRLQQQLLVQSQFARIPEEDHGEVDRYMRTGQFASPLAAYKAVKGDRADAAAKQKPTKEEPTTPAAPSRRPVATHTRGVPASEAKQRLSTQDFADQWDEARGKGDTKTIDTLMQRWRSGQVR